MNRTGSAILPLHSGKVPPWLSSRMARLGRVMVEALVYHYGRQEVLRRLAHPFWFQALGCVMGMDWHSSGVTTTVFGALKRGLAPVERELGLHLCGGKGAESRRTPAELEALGHRFGLEAERLVRASRLTAKVDSAAVQDGFEIYMHGFIVSDEGAWTVVQQGMNVETREARRYHWLSEGLTSFVDTPHAAIDGLPQGVIVNLTDARARRAREAQVELVTEGPDQVLGTLRKLREGEAEPSPQLALPHLRMSKQHGVSRDDVILRRLHGTLAAAAERGPKDFAELLLTPGVGAKTVVALASVAEVLHGAPYRFSDPARFSFAQGGKDRHPYPVRLDVYDSTLQVLRSAVDAAKLGNDEKLSAIRELDRQARLLEATATGPSFEALVAAGWDSGEEPLPANLSPCAPSTSAPPSSSPPATERCAIPASSAGRTSRTS
ncbi:MAG: DUF763 domain-containing protein [Hyalangium sp.]|uniref:DUF763 domain-containing protein n=1 Tax=Hyalangium sp. TaxID=2028555 RepID=UPI00389B1361